MNTPSSSDRQEDFDDVELMLHRFIDQDLDPEERLRFLELLDQNHQLRQRLLEMERLLLHAGSLPRVAPPPDLTTQVLKRLEPVSPGFLEKVKGVLWAPHVLHWNPATALIAACAVIALAWGLNQSMFTSSSISSSVQVAEVTPSGRQEESLMVRLILVQPEARSVAVAGDFNSWMPDQTPLRETDDGIWTVTLHVKPGRYHYMFVVDGERWVADPLAGEYSLDGFGAKNSVLDVATTL